MGGTVDPKTGKIVWTMHRPLEEQLAFYRSHPPAVLKGLQAKAIELPEWTFDGHGEPVNAIFELTCACGSRSFSVWAWRDGDELPDSPVSLACSGCDAEYDVFDANVHGYDGVMNPPDEPYDPEGDPVDLFWDGLEYEYPVLVRFEFPSDHLGDAEVAGREPELFSWITILGRTPKGELVQVFEYECA
jgi:hypothetical protein